MVPLIGGRASRHNGALDVFDPLLGEWVTAGSHPLLPGVALHGRASFERIEGGAFLLMRTEVDDARIPDGVAVLGSDDDGRFSLLYFDERGVSRRYEAAVLPDGFEWSRDDPDFSQRNRISVLDGGERLHAAGAMSRERGDWEPDLELTYERPER